METRNGNSNGCKPSLDSKNRPWQLANLDSIPGNGPKLAIAEASQHDKEIKVMSDPNRATPSTPKPIPDYAKRFVQRMLPTIPIDKLWITSDYGERQSGFHYGWDIQAKSDWTNCEKEASKGKWEPVLSPINGRVLEVHRDEREFLDVAKKIENPDYLRITGIIIALLDLNGRYTGEVIGVRHLFVAQHWRVDMAVHEGDILGSMDSKGLKGYGDRVHLHIELGRISDGKAVMENPAAGKYVNTGAGRWIERWNSDPYYSSAELQEFHDTLPKTLPFNQCWPTLEAKRDKQWPRDPLIVNLDGNGIKTVGLDAGVHFDHVKQGQVYS